MTQTAMVDDQSQRGFVNRILSDIVKYIFGTMDIELDGKRAGDFRVLDERVFMRIIMAGSGLSRLALGESYMDGYWESDLMAFFDKLLDNRSIVFNPIGMFVSNSIHLLPFHLFNMHTKSQSKKDVTAHYDIGNDMFRAMLGQTMNYSCAYWIKNVALKSEIEENPENRTNKIELCSNIDEAQMNKMLLIGKKLNLKPGMTVLDIGCGWGTMAKFLAVNFDVHVTGVTISEEQYEYAINNDVKTSELDYLRVPGLKPKGTGKFEFRLQDYRDVKETYDRIYCIEMIEHVGFKNYQEYFKIVDQCLKDDGLYFLHVISSSRSWMPSVDPFIHKYVFPGFQIPHHQQLIDCFEGKFVVEDWHNLGYCFYRTLAEWHKRFQDAWPQLEKNGYDKRFYRMFCFYLTMCATLFKKRLFNLLHIVLSKNGLRDGYTSYR